MSADSLLRRFPPLRRLAWRAGRRLYCAARGEPRQNAIATNGEAYLQRKVVAARRGAPLAVMDIGANEGEWTLSLLDAIGAAAHDGPVAIHAFEPASATFDRLLARLEGRPAGACVTPRRLALSDSCGNARIALTSPGGGTNSLHAGSATPSGGFETVETVDLTECCRREGIDHLHLVKSDAEGHDPLILRGALDMLRAERIDIFQFEYNHRWVFSRFFLADVFELVEGLPYSVARIMPDGVEILPGWRPELERFFEANYALVRRPALDWLDCRRGRYDDSNTYA